MLGRVPDTSAILAGLTPDQRRAVTSDAAPLCVLASAGAGKTRVLTRRVAYRLLDRTAEPGHVLVLTFTRKAAEELAGRLAGLGLAGAVTAGTFHATAAAQLRRWRADRGRRQRALLDDKLRLLSPLAAERPGTSAAAASDLLAHIDWARARMIPPESFEAAVQTHGRQVPAPAGELADLYERYQHEKLRRGVEDFDDLLAATAEAIEQDAEFAAAQRWRWRHVFVDEFQDVNPVQHRLLRSWLGEERDLFVVGDPHQAIYSWNGADPTLLDTFTERWPGAEVLRLEDNHRCTPEIVTAAAAVLGDEGRVHSSAPSGPAVAVRCYPTDTAEARGVASEVLLARSQGRQWSEIGVLVRTNAQVPQLLQAFTDAGVPFLVPGSNEERAERSAEHVTVCSFHRAKGLEWPAVWLCGLEQGLVPIRHATTPDAVDEERRLLYVAMTRASRELRCSWSALRTFGGHTVPREPSPWIAAFEPEGGGRRRAAEAEPVLDAAAWKERLARQRRLLRSGGPAAAGAHRRRPAPLPGVLAPAHRATLEDLYAWRAATARAAGVPAHVVLHDRSLEALASLRPATSEDLLAVPGLGPVKAARHGPRLLEIVAGHTGDPSG